MCFWPLCASGHSAQLVHWLESDDLTFSGTRWMELHQSGWFFRYQSNGIPSIWLIFQVSDLWNSINLVIEISKCTAPLHFKCELSWTAILASGTPQQWISREKTEKITFKKLFFPTWKLTLFGESPCYASATTKIMGIFLVILAFLHLLDQEYY